MGHLDRRRVCEPAFSNCARNRRQTRVRDRTHASRIRATRDSEGTREWRQCSAMAVCAERARAVCYAHIYNSHRQRLKRACALPLASVSKDGVVFLAFRIKGAQSPKAAGLSPDDRHLGLGLISLKI